MYNFQHAHILQASFVKSHFSSFDFQKGGGSTSFGDFLQVIKCPRNGLLTVLYEAIFYFYKLM